VAEKPVDTLNSEENRPERQAINHPKFGRHS
jgi:hypothetical protein